MQCYVPYLLHSIDISNKFRPYAYFQSYLKEGYYPFSQEDQFYIRLQQVINKTLEVDIPQYSEMSVSTARKLKQLLTIIARSVPFKPNMSSIATMLGVSRNSLSDYFLYLEEAGLIAQLRDDTGGIRGLGKVDKVYLDNSTLMYCLGQETADIGNIRETFFPQSNACGTRCYYLHYFRLSNSGLHLRSRWKKQKAKTAARYKKWFCRKR